MDFDDEDLDLEQDELIEATDGLNSDSENANSNSDEFLNENDLNSVFDELNPEESEPKRKSPFSGVVDKAKVVAKKGLKKIFSKYGVIIVGSGLLIFIIVLAVLSYQLDIDFYGIGNPKPAYYQELPTCGKVYLTWEKESYKKAHEKDSDYREITDPSEVDLQETDRFEYKEYEFDEYISGIVWTDNFEAYDINDEIVYEAMGVAARSRLIANLPDNCVVLKYHNEQAKSFKELEGTEEKYSEITNAVAKTQGLIIGRNNKAIRAIYEPFSYTYKRKEEDETKKDSYFYHMAHKNNEETQRIPANWVDNLEQEKNKKITHKTTEVKFQESMSLYGAKYLLEKIESQYKLYRILQYYYGNDIEYYTIDANFGNNLLALGNSCMFWPIGTTGNDLTFDIGTPASTRITSSFGYRGGVEGVATATKNHQAIDIGGGQEGGENINIIAAADGKVIQASGGCVSGNQGCGGGLGNFVKIQHSDGVVTRYAHLSLVKVKTGDTVKQGQIIGKMGNTGASNGVHLDFQVLVNGNPVDPLNYVSPTNPRPENCGLNVPILTPSGSGSGKESICIGFLNAGYTPAQTAGIMVNANGESGFNPNAFNASGGGMGAYGLFQWRGNRQKNLKALNNYTKSEVQVAFALSELNSSEANAKKHVMSSATAVDASYNFCVYYERPGSDMASIQKACQGRRNESLANEFYNYAMNGCK